MKILHLDIETSPNLGYIWGLWNQNIAIGQLQESTEIMCWAAKWHGEKKVHFQSSQKQDLGSMMFPLWELMDEADVLVHYNGIKFDVPHINREFLLDGLEPPNSYHQVDLLRIVRNRFRFPSNKLDYVADKVLGEKKTSHTGFQMWRDCMNGDKKAWKLMKEYNIQDVQLLERLYNRLLPWINTHPNHGLYTDSKRPVCNNCGSSNVIMKGKEYTKTQIYQRYRCSDCGTPLRGKATVLDKEKRSVLLTHPRVQ